MIQKGKLLWSVTSTKPSMNQLTAQRNKTAEKILNLWTIIVRLYLHEIKEGTDKWLQNIWLGFKTNMLSKEWNIRQTKELFSYTFYMILFWIWIKIKQCTAHLLQCHAGMVLRGKKYKEKGQVCMLLHSSHGHAFMMQFKINSN